MVASDAGAGFTAPLPVPRSIPGDGGYPLADGVEVLGLAQLAERIHGQR
jgi:hypothetical protein